MPIMGFISYFAIPCNTLIILICRFPSVPVGWNQDLDAIDFEEKSNVIQYLEKRDPYYWNRANIFLLAICLEHLVIALKVVIALVIPDVPYKVQEDEFRRVKIIEKVQKELLEIKYAGNHETFEDITARLQREAAKHIEDEIKRENDEMEKELQEKDESEARKAEKLARRKQAAEKQEALLRDMANARQKAMMSQQKNNSKANLAKRRRKQMEKKRSKSPTKT